MRFYQDISHFRAPYKNYQTLAGLGIETGESAPPANPYAEAEAATAAIATVGEDGIRRFRPEAVTSIRTMLSAYNAVWLSDTTVRVEPFTPESIAQAAQDKAVAALLESRSAAKWVNDKIAAGFAIYAPFTILAPNVATLAGAGIQMATVPATDYDKAVEASKLPIGAFLADPKDGWAVPGGAAKVVPAGIADPKHALIALAIVGGAGVLFFGISKVMERRRIGRTHLAGSLAR